MAWRAHGQTAKNGTSSGLLKPKPIHDLPMRDDAADRQGPKAVKSDLLRLYDWKIEWRRGTFHQPLSQLPCYSSAKCYPSPVATKIDQSILARLVNVRPVILGDSELAVPTVRPREAAKAWPETFGVFG